MSFLSKLLGSPASPEPAHNVPALGKWIPSGQSITVSGLAIPGGMIYVGDDLRCSRGVPDPALINPRLPVAGAWQDVGQRQMDYWPSYSEIPSTARRAYLQWLASGRTDPSADIGYVFLFFYGLERRTLIDSESDASAKAEIPLIKEEIRRLLRIYHTRNSFRGYATRFLDYLDLSHSSFIAVSQSRPPDVQGRYDMPMALKVGLGRMAATSVAVPPEWALAWAKSDPAITLPTAVKRCGREFDQLFIQRYKARFPDGFTAPANRTRLKGAYRPASSGFAREVLSPIGDLPDVSAVIAPARKLQAVVDECATALAPFSRFIAKNTSENLTLEGLLLLPQPLWPPEAETVVAQLNKRIGEGLACITLGELTDGLGGSGALTRAKVRSLAHALAEIRIGIEPDVLAGARAPKRDDAIVVFRTLPEDGSASDTATYLTAALTLDVGCSVALADGKACANELRFLMKQIDGWVGLTAAHRKRLRARMRLGLAAPPTLSASKKKLAELPIAARKSIGELMAALAQADGVVTPDEVKLLEKVYWALGLDPQAAYSDLHRTGLRDAEPSAAPTARQSSMPQTAETFVLDAARIEVLQRETEQVSALLAKVFVEESAPAAETIEELAEAHATPEPGLLGLDPEHSVFLSLILTRASWKRQELLDAAADMELMLDGAIERINESALSQLEEALLEGDDPIEVSQLAFEKGLA